MMSLSESEWTRKNTYVVVALFFIASLGLADYTIRFYVYVLHAPAPHQVIAGFTEPITTKLIPAAVVVYLHRRDDLNLDIAFLGSHPVRFAVLGGLSVGTFERVLYVVVRDAAITPWFLVAPAMHVLNAVLIAGVVFATGGRLRSYRAVATLVGVTVAAMAIHVWWNVWGVHFVHGLFT